MWIANLIERFRCNHKWIAISKCDIVEYPGPFSAVFGCNGHITGQEVKYQCEYCKSVKVVKV
jgi:hypothetical protein